MSGLASKYIILYRFPLVFIPIHLHMCDNAYREAASINVLSSLRQSNNSCDKNLKKSTSCVFHQINFTYVQECSGRLAVVVARLEPPGAAFPALDERSSTTPTRFKVNEKNRKAFINI